MSNITPGDILFRSATDKIRAVRSEVFGYLDCMNYTAFALPHSECPCVCHHALHPDRTPEATEAVIEALEAFIATPNRILEEHNPNFRRVFLKEKE